MTKPGLSPIYGAVLESRRIFSRIKAYVIYRVAASLILVLTLSTLIFATGCSVDTVLIIILALVNDISMIPVAYDNAKATTKPQLPRTKKLVFLALFYGIFQTLFAILFIFGVNHDRRNNINLHMCNTETQAFVWYYLVLVTELLIFSVRAPSFLLMKSTPSVYLMASVLGTCVIGALIACFGFGLSADMMGYTTIMNLGMLLVVDALKILFRRLINDEPGEVIDSDELIQQVEHTDCDRSIQKKLRYIVHDESKLEEEETLHQIIVREKTRSNIEGFFFGNSSILGDGLVRQDMSSIRNGMTLPTTST